jgi:putative sterol carrier protein
MTYEFLSAEWVKAVREIRDEYAEQVPDVPLPAVRVNLTITDAPDSVDAEGVVRAHADTSAGAARGLVLELGALPEPDFTLSVDYDTAYALLVDQRPNAFISAFLMGRIKIAGDVQRLAEESGLSLEGLPALLSSLGITGSSTLADVDPVAAEVGERIRAITT